MIDLIKKFFGPEEEAQERNHDIRIATCALLLEMANIDGEFTEPERDRILSFVKEDYDLSDEEAQALIEASHAELEGSVDLWRFTTLINKNYSMEEKIGIIEMIWRIAYADAELDKHEDYVAHKVARLLNLTNQQRNEGKGFGLAGFNWAGQAFLTFQ
jgi:uncharacterized tellurite resistance protein B-like protein